MNTSENLTSTFPKGENAPAAYFTGTVWLNILVPKDETENYVVSDVVFAPHGRTNWHTHPAGQILLVTDGSGYYQEQGNPVRFLTKGDVVVIPSQVKHWHGAAHDSSFTHIAITNITPAGTAEWLEPVSDEAYNSFQPGG